MNVERERCRRWVGALLPLLGLLLITPTRADEGARGAQRHASGGARENSEYRALIEEALREFELGNANEALVLFQRAHALSPNARTLRGIGFCLFEARRYVEASLHLEQALADTRNPLTPGLRSSTEQLLTRASAFVGHVFVVLAPEEARLSIDGSDAARPPTGELLLDPGEHELSASAPGHHAHTLKVLIKSGSNDPIRLSLTAVSLQVQAAPQPAVQAAPAPREPPSRSGRGLMIGGFSVAGAGIAAGTVTGILALLAEKELQSQCPDNACPPDHFDDLDRANALALGSTLALSVAGAGVVCGLVGALLSRADKPPASAARPTWRASANGIAGSF